MDINPHNDLIAGEIWKELAASPRSLSVMELQLALDASPVDIEAALKAMIDRGLVGIDKRGSYWPVDDSWLDYELAKKK